MIEQTVRELLEDHVTLDIEGIDRLYLNLYQPRLQTGGGVAAFFKGHRGAKVASTTLMTPMSHAYVHAIERFARDQGVDLIRVDKGRRKNDETQKRLKSLATSAPRSSSTSRKGAPCVPRPRSTTPMTSGSDGVSRICPPCGLSASMPIAVCSKSRPSARTLCWPTSFRYRLTAFGLRVALFFTKVQHRILRPGLSQVFDGCLKTPDRFVNSATQQLDQALNRMFEQAKLETCKI
jgi:hypothetical protein